MIYPDLNKFTHVETLDGEVWLPVLGAEGEYEVSNYGRVKRLAYFATLQNQVTSWQQFMPNRVLKANPDTRGYPQVMVKCHGESRLARVHRLVAESFLEPPSQWLVEAARAANVDYVVVNHLDGNTFNPRPDNLEWCTVSHNNSHTTAKRQEGYKKSQGSNSYNAVLTDKDVIEIIDLLRHRVFSQEKIAETYGVKQITISNLWCGRSWSHLTGIPWKARSRRAVDTPKVAEKVLKSIKEDVH